MLRKGCVEALKAGGLTRERGHIVVAMCHYPRGIAKRLIDEYVKDLAPTKELLDAFHVERERLDGNHNAAFLTCRYQERFSISSDGVKALDRLAELSANKDVFLVCQCKMDQRCHRELLLIMAKKWWGATTELRTFSYPEFERRLGVGAGEIS